MRSAEQLKQIDTSLRAAAKRHFERAIEKSAEGKASREDTAESKLLTEAADAIDELQDHCDLRALKGTPAFADAARAQYRDNMAALRMELKRKHAALEVAYAAAAESLRQTDWQAVAFHEMAGAHTRAQQAEADRDVARAVLEAARGRLLHQNPQSKVDDIDAVLFPTRQG